MANSVSHLINQEQHWFILIDWFIDHIHWQSQMTSLRPHGRTILTTTTNYCLIFVIICIHPDIYSAVDITGFKSTANCVHTQEPSKVFQKCVKCLPKNHISQHSGCREHNLEWCIICSYKVKNPQKFEFYHTSSFSYEEKSVYK